MTDVAASVPLWWIVAWIVQISCAGFAILVWCLAPARQRRALDRLSERPLTSLLIGVATIVILSVAVAVVRRMGWIGQGGGILTLLPLLFATGAGLGVTARRLGERAAPDASPMGHLGIGLVALVLCGLSIVGIPIVMLAAAVGFGAFLLAGAKR